MDITALQKKIEHYRALEDDVIAQQVAATTDKQRFEFERMRRIITVLVFSLLARARNEVRFDAKAKPAASRQRAPRQMKT
jgi:hypothetical protein